MKFLCDRCKTRYSIGDDRVRGKILKIRCKNCANVITVREGMVADPDGSVPAPAGSEPPARSKKATTMAPAALDERADRAAARPPPAAGAEQGGAKLPASAPGDRAAGARGPVGGAANDAAAARDKVKDRAGAGQAKRGGHAEPDEVARASPAAGKRVATPGAGRGEPVNALNAAFASAMAKPPPALEEEWYVSIDGDQAGPFSLGDAQRWVAQKPFDAELHCWSEGFDDWLPVDKVSHFRGLRKRPPPAVAPPPLPRVAGAPRAGAAAPPADDEPKPLFAATMAALERAAPPASSPGLKLPQAAASVRATPPLGTAIPARGNAPGRPVNGAPASPAQARPGDARPGAAPAGAAPARPAGDLFGSGDAADSKTEIEAQAFSPPAEPRRGPLATGRVAEPRADSPGSSEGAPTTRPPAAAAADFEGDGELHIGEVSRVVKLADIARPRGADRPAVGRRTGAVPAAVTGFTGPTPVLRATGAVPSMAGAPTDGAPPAPADPSTAFPPAARSHHRGLIALLGVAGVMVLGVVAAVILFVTRSDDSTGSRLGPVRDIDTSRPEDPITHRPIEPGATAPAPQNVPRSVPHPRVAPPISTGSARDLEPPVGSTLSGEEIEEVAHKHEDATRRCYMRAQRGANSILVGDVKKIDVTLTIDRDGNVDNVKLSDHASDSLGSCLNGFIKAWKFRPSAGGLYRITLVFPSA